MQPQEKKLTEACINLLGGVMDIYKMVLKFYDAMAASDSNPAPEMMSVVNDIDNCSSQLASAFLETADGLYPPQSQEEVKQNLKGFRDGVARLCQFISVVDEGTGPSASLRSKGNEVILAIDRYLSS